MLLFIIGTRPELIKIAPLILELKKREFDSFSIVNTGQHRELLDIYWDVFGVKPDYNLNVILPNQDLSSLTTRAIDQLNQLVHKITEEKGRPRFLIGQGDTTTVLAASMVAFYHKIDFVHIEAGLRSFDLNQPYPEEFNRRVASIAARIHFAPTESARQNLLHEHVPEHLIRVVGNTGIDALSIISASSKLTDLHFGDQRLQLLLKKPEAKIILITCHRRENHDDNLIQIIEAVKKIGKQHPDYSFVWPVHANPKVKEVVLSSALASMDNVILTSPLDYLEVVKILKRCVKVITDSGGLQEESPSFHIPVLVLREKTERPEAVTAGYSLLVGSDTQKIVDAFANFNPVFPNGFQNPYGDGNASLRIIDFLLKRISER